MSLISVRIIHAEGGFVWLVALAALAVAAYLGYRSSSTALAVIYGQGKLQGGSTAQR